MFTPKDAAMKALIISGLDTLRDSSASLPREPGIIEDSFSSIMANSVESILTCLDPLR